MFHQFAFTPTSKILKSLLPYTLAHAGLINLLTFASLTSKQKGRTFFLHFSNSVSWCTSFCKLAGRLMV